MLFWQVALANRFGSVTLYDDTAIKNSYRIPVAYFVVVDGEYNTRAVAQALLKDTTTETLVWLLESYKDGRDGPPETFIHVADAAMAAAQRKVFPDTMVRRCQWHLRQNLLKNLGPLLGSGMQVRRGPVN